MVRQAVLLQPMEVDGGADIHLHPMEDPMPEQVDAPKGGHDPVGSPRWSRLLAGPVALWREEPTLKQEPFVIFSLPCPAEEGSDRAALGGTWPPAWVNPQHLEKRRLQRDLTAAFQYLKGAYRKDGKDSLSGSVVIGLRSPDTNINIFLPCGHPKGSVLSSSRTVMLNHLINFYDEMTGLVDQGKIVDVVYLDFTKAFDTVSHKILRDKLLMYRVDEQSVRSWRTGEVPEDWRKANVTLIFKKGKKEDPGNYRPVSLTSIPGKMMEQLILGVINKHVEEKVIGSGRYGLTKGKSCLTNLIVFYDGMTSWVDEGRAVDVVYLDFSKAFDIVSHNILISKLRKCGLDEWSVRWVENWLNGRAQRVVTSSAVHLEACS
ncbi:mitochondrial enolase superfamily member 1 [Grus japonensis]|uniref:Mitochondrial enolase superfamily member 1 n=1 Tax=Grus japonensis TaxID=30415 RepID=A0ABC9WFI9_GRUJA